MSTKMNLRICLAISLFLLGTLSTANGKVIFVDADATGANNGTNWANAYPFLQDALTDANSSAKPVEIRVAQGTYRPDEDTSNSDGTGDRAATFQLIKGVTIKGGYAGFGQPDPNARDIELYETILSGDLNANDVDVSEAIELWDAPTRAENSFNVVTGTGADETAVIDGFTISGGNADNGPPTYGSGGGMYTSEGSPTLLNCIFYANFGISGAGMFCKGGGPVLNNCKFSVNFAPGSGAGMDTQDSTPILTNCTFSNNHSHHGGAMYNVESSLTLTNCIFSGNKGHIGGGIYNDKSSLTLTKCTFFSNFTTHSGGAISSATSSLTLTNCTFIGNSTSCGGAIDNGITNMTLTNCIFNGNRASQHGGGLSNHQGELVLTNCTLAGNTAPEGNAMACQSYGQQGQGSINLRNCILWNGGNEISNDGGLTVTITYSDVQDGQSGIYDPCDAVVWGTGNIDVDPCFVELGHWEDPCNTPDNFWDDFWLDGDYHLKSQAGRWDPNTQTWVQDEVISPCIDAGDPMSPIGPEPFPNGGIINMGAYGGTAEASKSYFGEPPCEIIVAGDINGDCIVNFLDFRLMALHWLRDEN